MYKWLAYSTGMSETWHYGLDGLLIPERDAHRMDMPIDSKKLEKFK